MLHVKWYNVIVHDNQSLLCYPDVVPAKAQGQILDLIT